MSKKSKNDGFVMVYTSPDSDETTQLTLPAAKHRARGQTVLWLVLKAIRLLAWAAPV